MTYIALALFALGCFVSLMNFYLSFLRYPLFRLRGGAAEEYRWVSGCPLFGSLLVVISLAFVFANAWLFWFGVACAVLDMGGLHWFVGAMLYMNIRGKT